MIEPTASVIEWPVLPHTCATNSVTMSLVRLGTGPDMGLTRAASPPAHQARSPSADLRADLAVQRAQLIEHRVDRARTRLEDRGRVERHPLKAHRLELDHPAQHAIV